MGLGIVAPASWVPDAVIETSFEWFEANEIPIKSFFSKAEYFRTFSATDEVRARNLLLALRDPSVDVVLCGRGGYGGSRILGMLDALYETTRNKPFIGYSDATSLLNLGIARRVFRPLHGPMLVDIFKGLHESDALQLLRVIRGEDCYPVCYGPAEGVSILRSGAARGFLFGGNATVFCHLIGTPYMPDPSGGVLLLEDIGEAYYKMFSHLHNAGILSRLSELIMGSYESVEDGDDLKFQRNLPEIIEEWSQHVHGPVAINLPTGHGSRKQCLEFGCAVSVIADRSSLTIGRDEHGV